MRERERERERERVIVSLDIVAHMLKQIETGKLHNTAVCRRAYFMMFTWSRVT